jgi:methylenetetrahydrofolate dehydrogenase (NADP+)/methenyltetrahydrofolate cyclohydrolase
MPARILDGRLVADATLAEVRAAVAARARDTRPPCLAAVLVGDDPASHVYVRNKIKRCAEVGIDSRLEALSDGVSQVALEERLHGLGADRHVDGILLQLPLPRGLDARRALASIDPAKDVDGLHVANLGKLVADDPSGFVPCTPAGIALLLAKSDIDVDGLHVVILGRSTLVGRPLALLLGRRAPGGNATVTVAHTRSRDVPALVRSADVVVAAAGSPRFVRGEWLRPGAVVVDVGIHRVPAENGKTRLVGDVETEAAAEIAAAITPVPGGVGPMTVAMLMHNTVLAWRRRES